MRQKLLVHYLFLFSFFIFVAIRRNLFSWLGLSFWFGGILGTLLPDLDHLFYAFVYKEESSSFLSFKSYLSQKKYLSAFVSLFKKDDKEGVSVFHSFSFQLLFFVLTFWIVTSSSSLFALGLVLSFSLHLLVNQFSELMEKGNLDSWSLGFFKFDVPRDKHFIYWLVLVVIFVLFSLVF